MPDERKPLFVVTIKDCDVQTFRGHGKGGQKRNKTSSAVRVVHRASGATGESQDHREQFLNKREAFVKMANTTQFQTWVRMRANILMGVQQELERRVDASLVPENIRVEVMDEEGRWVVATL